MLQHRKIIFKYKSILKFLSFNKMAINKSIWLLRNMLRYIFFFLLKKSFFLQLIFYYKVVLYFFTLKKYILPKLDDICISTLVFKFFLQVKQFYSSFIVMNYSSLKIKILNSFFFFEKPNFYEVNLKSINIFFFFFKNFIFFLYIWLYSVKFFYFFSLHISSLPIKKHTFVVLRSPHKDKKSREKYKIKKLRKGLLIPSFIYNPYFFSLINNDSFLIKIDYSIKKT